MPIILRLKKLVNVLAVYLGIKVYLDFLENGEISWIKNSLLLKKLAIFRCLFNESK